MKWGKVALVICGAVIVTALGLDAADTLSGKSGTMLGQLVATDGDGSGVCPVGMIAMNAPTTFTCVDQYEASPNDDCAADRSSSAEDSKQLLSNADCGATSVAGTMPWTYVSRDDAALACAQAGKRLPSAAEWYQFALGTPDTTAVCNIVGGQLRQTGAHVTCVSANEVFDTVGNVWEWVTDDVFDGQYNNRPLPEEGYVAAVDQAGIATVTETRGVRDFGDDYVVTESSGVFGVMRGGFYGSRDDAGVFALQASIPTTFAGAAIGFRCVQ